MIIIMVYSFYFKSFSQTNLVPNCSFETYSICPGGGGSINYAIPWFQPNLAGGSSDFYHVCGCPIFGCPPNSAGFQFPRSGGGMIGINLFHDTLSTWKDWDREYIEVGLTDSLKPSKKYCVRYYTNKGNWSMWAIKNIQAVLTNDSLIYNDINYGYIAGVTPVMEANSIITDTLNWISVETIYTANGGERYLTIGNFSPGNTVNYQQVLPYSAVPNTLGYYLIDDVSVYEQPEVFAGNDTLLALGDSVQLGIAGRPDVFYSWQPSTGLNNPNIANPVAKPTTCITYTLTVTDTNQLACISVFTDVVKVDIQNCDTSATLTIPNVFSPNNDGINDEFKIKTKKITAFNCKIYDRWGILVAELTQPNETWNGHTTSGKEAKNGVYYYVIIATGEDGKKYDEKGYVQLVR